MTIIGAIGDTLPPPPGDGAEEDTKDDLNDELGDDKGGDVGDAIDPEDEDKVDEFLNPPPLDDKQAEMALKSWKATPLIIALIAAGIIKPEPPPK
ncbi:MAG TPA: hypothetical protein VFW95_05935 [Candidatus Limnocylindria bacterium]|nr:hypothetical protein [Candidatus Limnocylindria bacterium]